MRPTLRLVCICAVAAAIIVARASSGRTEKAEPASVAPTGDKPLIQVALLLDTSNSMDGLIDQAKTQLWNIVSEFATAKRDGKTPELQPSTSTATTTSPPAKDTSAWSSP